MIWWQWFQIWCCYWQYYSSRFSNLLTVLAYIDICYVTIELAHISIKIWASVIIFIFNKITMIAFYSKILLDTFTPGRSIERGGHLLFSFLPPLFSPAAPSIPDCHGPSHGDIQVNNFTKHCMYHWWNHCSLDRYIAVFHPYLVYTGQVLANRQKILINKLYGVYLLTSNSVKKDQMHFQYDKSVH